MKRGGLRTKLLIANTGVILVLGFSMIAFVTIVFPGAMIEALQEDWTQRVGRLAADATDPILSEDYLALQELLLKAQRSADDIAYAFILDKSGTPMAHTFEHGFPTGLRQLRLTANEIAGVRVTFGEKRLLDIGTPALEGMVGEVHVGFTTESVAARSSQMLKLLVAMVFAALVLQAFLTTLFGAMITRPILRLHDFAVQVRRLGKGELTEDLPVTSHDEINELAVAYNSMRHDLTAYEGRLRSLASELSRAEEHERHRTATELHDMVGQTMALSKVKLGALGAKLADSEYEDAVDEIRSLLEDMISGVRSLIFQLSPPILHELGLEAALEWLCEKTGKTSGLPVKFSRDRADAPLGEDQRSLLFRITSELLMNVVQHAEAGEASVTITHTCNTVAITVSDNGIGFAPTKVLTTQGEQRGFGLFSIRERLQSVNGTLSIESEVDKGTSVTVTVPLQEADFSRRTV